MAITSAAALEALFQEGDAPTSADFAAVFDSFLHKVSAGGTALAVRSLGAGAVGSALFATATTAAAVNQLGLMPTAASAGAVGQTLYDAITTASAKNNIGAGAVGTHLWEAATTASARRDVDLNVATTAQMSAPTNTSSAFITPGLIHYHPLVPKAWVRFNGAGTVSIRQAWNVASIGDLGLGLYRVNFGSAFPNNGYGFGGMCQVPNIAGPENACINAQGVSAGTIAAGDIQIITATATPGAVQGFDSSAISFFALDR